jgi:hypothetical protein
MFSKDIVRSDAFLSMSKDACLLYFQLGMEADDRGYINNMLTLIRMIGVSSDALKELIENKFVLKRTESLYLVKGWRVNNTIQPSRLVETKYTEDLKTLFFDENGSYTTTETEKPCLSTQISKEKDSKDKKKEIKEEQEEIDWDELMEQLES